MGRNSEETGLHHEHLVPDASIAVSSDRAFGVVIFAFWTLVALLPLLRSRPPRLWSFLLAAAFLVAAVAAPRVLHPLNLVWAKLALLLHRIVSPVALALLFFLAFTTTGAVLRLFGKDLLRLRAQAGSTTYWIPRDPPGPQPETMIHQF